MFRRWFGRVLDAVSAFFNGGNKSVKVQPPAQKEFDWEEDTPVTLIRPIQFDDEKTPAESVRAKRKTHLNGSKP